MHLSSWKQAAATIEGCCRCLAEVVIPRLAASGNECLGPSLLWRTASAWWRSDFVVGVPGKIQGPLDAGVLNGGFPDLDLFPSGPNTVSESTASNTTWGGFPIRTCSEPGRIWFWRAWLQTPKGGSSWSGLVRKRAEHGFGEHGFKHRTRWVFCRSTSSGERAQWVPLGLLFVCQSELTEFSQNAPRLLQNSVSSLFRNTIMEDWDTDLSPSNFATTHFPGEREKQLDLDHPCDSSHSGFLSPFNFATHEMEDPFARPQSGRCWLLELHWRSAIPYDRAEKKEHKDKLFWVQAPSGA